MPKTELRLRRYKQSKIARKLGFRGREVNRKIPDPDLDRARTPRRRRYCSPATTGKEAAAGDEGTGGRGGGCRGGAGVEAGDAARRRRRRGGGGCSGRGGAGPAAESGAAARRGDERRRGSGRRRRRRAAARGRLWPERSAGRAGPGPSRAGDVGAGAVAGGHVAAGGWLGAAADVVRLARTRPSAADLARMIFFRVSGRGRDPKTEGCIYRHRGS